MTHAVKYRSTVTGATWYSEPLSEREAKTRVRISRKECAKQKIPMTSEVVLASEAKTAEASQ